MSSWVACGTRERETAGETLRHRVILVAKCEDRAVSRVTCERALNARARCTQAKHLRAQHCIKSLVGLVLQVIRDAARHQSAADHIVGELLFVPHLDAVEGAETAHHLAPSCQKFHFEIHVEVVNTLTPAVSAGPLSLGVEGLCGVSIPVCDGDATELPQRRLS